MHISDTYPHPYLSLFWGVMAFSTAHPQEHVNLQLTGFFVESQRARSRPWQSEERKDHTLEHSRKD